MTQHVYLHDREQIHHCRGVANGKLDPPVSKEFAFAIGKSGVEKHPFTTSKESSV